MSRFKFKSASVVLLTMSLLGGASLFALPSDEVQKVFDKYRAVRPEAKDLAIFQLDWVPSLKDARAKAAREQRPIFLIVVTNSYGNMYTGHC